MRPRGDIILTAEEIRDKLTPLFADPSLQLVLLFGSVASGKVHAKSDIDLAFLFDGVVDSIAFTNTVIRRLRTDNVDVVDLRHASPLLRISAIKTGKLLYERSPGLYKEFCSLSFRMYADASKFRIARQKAIRKFLEARGMA